MSDKSKPAERRDIPRDLPMPKYGYQASQGGVFVMDSMKSSAAPAATPDARILVNMN